MKKLTATKFRNLLSALMVLAVLLIAGAFVFGYKHLQSVQESTHQRQADAETSNDSISQLQQLQSELRGLSDTVNKLGLLRSSNSMPQFDTEESLRTISRQLDIPVGNITFVGTGGSAESTGEEAQGSQSQNSQWAGPRNSRISFEFTRDISYNELIRFLHAIETSTPKLRIDGLDLPQGSSRSSIDPGTLILEMATE